MGIQADETHTAETMTTALSSLLPGWQEGIPLIRLFACGPFTIEVLHEVPAGDSAQARYVPLPPERLHGRGPAPALTFLKLLTSQRDRYAPKDWLIEHLRGDEYLITPKRLENIVSFVRQLLSLPDGTRPAGMLRYVRASHESGDGYRLAPYPLIWLDVDAIAATVRQACLLERFGDEALPYWERAYQLASRGTYLAEEPYSQWAEARREEVEGHLRQCVHALARLWLARYGATAEEEVLHLLRSYWPRHPEDEDVAWGLMDLLGRRGRYQEALEVYACLEQSLEEEGLTKEGEPRTPDQRTRDLADYLRLKERQPIVSRPPQQEAVPPPASAQVQQQGMLALPTPFIAAPDHHEMLAHFSRALPQGISEAVLAAHQSLALPLACWEMPSDEATMGIWMARSAALLGPLLDASWSFDALIESLRIIVPVVKAMPTITRRSFLQVGAATMLGGLSLFESKQISEEEVGQFCQALSESCIAGWDLFHSAGMGQVLAVGQALLLLLQTNHSLLPPRLRSVFYTSVYNLIGCAFHAEARHEAALAAHSQAQVAAMGTGSSLPVAQSLICQASSYQALERFGEAEQVLEEALLLLEPCTDETSVRAKAHVLACWADVVMTTGERALAQQKLEASATYLDQIAPNEEFDQTSWLQLVGKHALYVGDYRTAIHHFEQALAALPAHLLLQAASILLPLAAAYVRAGEREASLTIAHKVLPIVTRLNAQMTNKHLATYLRQDVLPLASDDARMRAFVQEVYAQLPPIAALIGSER